MPSLQQSAGSGKAAKFVQANPFGPMADPFAGMGDDEKEYHKQLSDNINKRMEDSISELQERHAKGTNELDDPDRAPTGSAYKVHAQMKREKMMEERRRREEMQRLKALKEDAKSIFVDKNNENDEDNDGFDNKDNDGFDNDSDDSDDDEYNDLLNDSNAELEAIRERRIREMREMQMKKAEQKSLGHGEVRTITQDEFLPECTGKSEWVAVHFFHKEFNRCTIMDHHLKLIAPKHLSCKFLRMDAEKAPFFIHKLCIKTLPTLIVFREGKNVERLTGFEGLIIDPSEPDKWHTGRLEQWLASTGAIQYKVPTEEIKEEMRRMGIRP
eukprot:CAMPEP_0203691304 /NCGR_PEP_ID=MMETSP0091-20130426/3634_1 /ASSEMBLY_ACC=CAM_ASM_001089 /TAXON_ID=426623 /ORGANISM="Chaetoceros affinis, Strain CCMP159" /LENGTH=326 /DNA_ID=CAMNT_0050561765 /DNA_START=11 /DNA_END=987 /DNA_ORIENTATION=+